MNYTERRINEIKNEILDLKTACRYTSTRNANISQFPNVHTGLYRVTFEKDGIFASYYPGYIPGAGGTWATCYARTFVDTTQVIEIESTTFGDDPDGPRIDNYITLTIVSSVKIINFERIS